MDAQAIQLDRDHIAQLFPAFLVLDRALNIVATGPLLAQLAPELAAAQRSAPQSFGAWFSLHRPSVEVTYDHLRDAKSGVVVVELRGGALRLRGQVLVIGDGLCLACAPVIGSVADMRELGLTMHNLAPHSSLADFLFLAQSKTMVIDDLRVAEAEIRRKRDELIASNARLQASEQRFRSIVEGATQPILLVTRAGDVVMRNGAADKAFGLDGRAPGALSVADLFMPAEQVLADWRELSTTVVDVGDRSSCDMTARNMETNEAFPASLSITVCESEGPLVLLVRDLSREHATREHLEAAKEAAEQANRAKTEFLATISHEIRTPMNAILGMAQIALDTSSLAIKRDSMERVLTNAEALLGLINQLLDISKIEARQLIIEERSFSPHDVVYGVADTLFGQAAAREPALECTLAIDPNLPAELVGDPQRLRQILLNLLGNAVKFTLEGSVSLTCELVAGQRGAKPRLCFRVTDTGIGIAPDKLGRVFDKFYRVTHADDTQRFEGTGLGLNITHALTEMLGGSIAVESELGQGTTFELTLPFEQVSDEPAVSLNPRARGRRVAVIAADSPAAQFLVKLFQRRGFEAAVHPHGEAIGDADLLYLDCGWLEQDPETRALVRQAKLPMVAVVGQGVAPPAELPINKLLVRPVGNDKPVRAVEEVLNVSPKVAKVANTRRARVGAPAIRPAKVLIVDDERDQRHVIEEMLKTAGHTTKLVVNGEQALAEVCSRHYDAILLDIEMPSVDGFQVAREVREHEASTGARPTPIVAVTARAMPGVREACLEAGMDIYLAKPVRRAHLLAALSRCVDPRPVVVIADDSPVNIEVMRRILAKFGDFRVLTAFNGQQALDLLDREEVDLLLLDMEMPVLDGYATARRVKANIPVVAVTGHVGPEERARCDEAGCRDHLAKPLRLDAVESMLNRWLPRTPSGRVMRPTLS